MGTLAITEFDVWYGASWFIKDIIHFALDRAGPKEYLLEIKWMFEGGYNHGQLYKLSESEFNEFRKLVQAYLDEGVFDRFTDDRKRTAKTLEDIIRRMDRARAPRE